MEHGRAGLVRHPTDSQRGCFCCHFPSVSNVCFAAALVSHTNEERRLRGTHVFQYLTPSMKMEGRKKKRGHSNWQFRILHSGWVAE